MYLNKLQGCSCQFQTFTQFEKGTQGIGCSYPCKGAYLLCFILKEKNYSKENEVTKMERLLGFVKEPLIEREIKMKDQQPKK